MHGYGGHIPIGSIAGSVVDNRVNLHINRDGGSKLYKAHRVAWLLMTGEWPEHEIDHIDTNPTNNAWSNLRLANRSENCMNRNRQANNTSGYKGVSSHGSGFRAQIWRDGRRYGLGTYRTPERAYEAYCEAAATLHGSFSRC